MGEYIEPNIITHQLPSGLGSQNLIVVILQTKWILSNFQTSTYYGVIKRMRLIHAHYLGILQIQAYWWMRTMHTLCSNSIIRQTQVFPKYFISNSNFKQIMVSSISSMVRITFISSTYMTARENLESVYFTNMHKKYHYSCILSNQIFTYMVVHILLNCFNPYNEL